VSETCRVIINQVKQKLHLVGYLLIRYFREFFFDTDWIHPANNRSQWLVLVNITRVLEESAPVGYR